MREGDFSFGDFSVEYVAWADAFSSVMVEVVLDVVEAYEGLRVGEDIGRGRAVVVVVVDDVDFAVEVEAMEAAYGVVEGIVRLGLEWWIWMP